MKFDDSGAQIDTWLEVREDLSRAFKGLFGDDFGVDDEDTSVGKLVTIVTDMTDRVNQKVQYAISAFDPDSARGFALKKVLKLNGLTANEGLYSTVSVTLYASAFGTGVFAGDKVRDPNNRDVEYRIDSNVTVPPNSSVTVSAKCTTRGKNKAAPQTITEIATPREGWISVINPSRAAPGQDEESDTAMRRRRHRRSRAAGKTTLAGVWSALEDLDSVDEVFIHLNMDTVTDTHGVSGRSMRVYVSGGSDSDIVEVLFDLAPVKTVGSVTTNHEYRGHSYAMSYQRPTDISISVSVVLRPVSATSPAQYPATADKAIRAAIVAYSDTHQLMGIDAIPQQIEAVANVVDQYYVHQALINGVGTTMSAPMGHRLVIADDDITILVETNQ